MTSSAAGAFAPAVTGPRGRRPEQLHLFRLFPRALLQFWTLFLGANPPKPKAAGQLIGFIHAFRGVRKDELVCVFVFTVKYRSRTFI